MSLRDLTPEERTALQQSDPEEYARRAAEDNPKPKQRISINGRSVEVDNTQGRWTNGQKVQ